MIDMARLLREIETELPQMKWECASPTAVMAHFTGRGPKWTVQLVCLDNGQRMGAATTGGTVMKLTDELAELAERSARTAPLAAL